MKKIKRPPKPLLRRRQFPDQAGDIPGQSCIKRVEGRVGAPFEDGAQVGLAHISHRVAAGLGAGK